MSNKLSENLINNDLINQSESEKSGTSRVQFSPNSQIQFLSRSDTFTNQNLSFTRGYSSIEPIELLSRSFTNTFGFIRKATLNDISTADNDEIWTKSLLKTYHEQEEDHQVEGDVPLPAEFARVKEFWLCLLCSGFVAIVIGLAALGFTNVTEYIPKLWANDFYATKDDTYFTCPSCDPYEAFIAKETGLATSCSCDKYENCGFYQGKPYWILITTFTGLFVGSLRYAIRYPDNLAAVFKEILTYHVEPRWAPWSFLISLISLSGGISLGPEQALGCLGGGIATYICEKYVHFKDDGYRKLMVLGGFAAAFGCLFPTPVLGPLILLEVGVMPKSHMESVIVMSFSSLVSFLVYYAIIDDTFSESLPNTGIALSLSWEFNEWNCGTAALFGVLSAAFGIVIMLGIGISNKLIAGIRQFCRGNKLLACTLPPTCAGFIIGFINYALPLTIGNGNMVFSSIISYGGVNNLLSQRLLICTGFAKVFLLGISMSGGFVGGFVFPLLFIGVIAGVVAHLMFPYLPLGLCVGCFMAGIPCSLVPSPYSLSFLVISSFYFGIYQTVPIFITAIVSYVLVVGSGIYGGLQRRAHPEQYDLHTHEIMIQKKAEEEFAIKQYQRGKEHIVSTP